MAIRYSLHPNCMDKNSHTLLARVQKTNSLDLDGICKRIVSQGTTVTEVDVKAVLIGLVAACEDTLLEGGRVNLGGLVELYSSLKGVFDGPQDNYDASRHQVDVRARPGTQLRKTIRKNAKVTRVGSTVL